jgi:putative transposase
MLVTALEAEVASYLEGHSQERDARGHALVVRTAGRDPEGDAGGGDDRNGSPASERPALGRWRQPAAVQERDPAALHAAFAEGGGGAADPVPAEPFDRDFRPALEGLLGKDAAGLSAANITRLTAEWEAEYQAFRKSRLAEKDYIYVWVDGITST